MIRDKFWVALSGALLGLWAWLHMAGTLGVFAGAEVMNGYANLLRRVPFALWVMRVGLLCLFVLHVGLTLRLARRAHKARPIRYAHSGSTSVHAFVSRSMRVTGPVLGVWLGYHVLVMYGPLHPDYVPSDVYFNLVAHLERPLANLANLLAAILFGFHLLHGGTSTITTLGLGAHRAKRAQLAWLLLTSLLTLGFCAPSLGVLAGLLTANR